MNSRWSNTEAENKVKEYTGKFPNDTIIQAYATSLLGCEPELTLHGGGNTSVKTTITDSLGEQKEALFVKASGVDMNTFTPSDFVVLDQSYLAKLINLKNLSDEEMATTFSLHMLAPSKRLPSIETLLHAFIPFKFVTHTHPTALLALTNRENSGKTIGEIFGDDLPMLQYARSGYDLAKAAATAIDNAPGCRGLMISHHGLVTWGNTAEEAYAKTLEFVNRAEEALQKKRTRSLNTKPTTKVADAIDLYKKFAPAIRGVVSAPSGDADQPIRHTILQPIIDEPTLELLSSEQGKSILDSSPLTPDYLIRTRTVPMWIDTPDLNDPKNLKEQLTNALSAYIDNYKAYIGRHDTDAHYSIADIYPRVICIPGLGVICTGDTIKHTTITKDITAQGIALKRVIWETGGAYNGLSEDHMFNMEFRMFQRAKVDQNAGKLQGAVAVVTGSAGAIGSGICTALLESGCHVAVSDLPGPNLDTTVDNFQQKYGARAQKITMDVTNQDSVAEGFAAINQLWGGIDIVVVNAGIAHVSALEDMDIETFRKLEKVNVEGTLLTIRNAAKVFRIQGTAGDIVLVSTKNVFAPGAKFGAYSATKAASHQLGRIAVLELADIGIRVNMVAPDAVFSHGAKKSGLWAEVGPDRMKARGLDEKGLEDYYQSRNLLKAKITAAHVGNAVLFFVTHQTPTTGATIPVDGGLPDATPR